MKTLTNRTNDKFKFLTIVFGTKQEAKDNVNEDMGQFVARVFKSVNGEDGFVVANSANDFHESIKVSV